MSRPAKENWVDALLQEISTGKPYRRLIQKCIDNMDVPKLLYKYYDLKSEFTFPNLENSQNYYNNPTAFNDPFDCNIGVSADQIIRLCMPGVCEQAFGTDLDPAVRSMIDAVMFGDAATYDDDSDESVIAACLECPDISDLIFRAQAGENIDDGIIAQALFNNADVLALMLSKYPGLREQGNNANIEEQIKKVAWNSAKLMRQLLNKAAADQVGATKEIFAIMGEEDDLLKRLQKIARLYGYAEEANKINFVYDQLEQMVKQMHIKLGEVIGITCFSETPKNMLMWSHYANRHTGICVEYDFSRLFSTAANTLLFPVTYTNKRPLFPIDKLEIGADGKVKDGQTLPAGAVPEIIKALTVKSKVWEYEREWRHIVFTKDAPDRLIKLPIISKIILGINISPEDKEKIIELAGRKHIPVYATRLKADKYEMIIMDQPASL